jgi:hypothetical protein
MPLPFGETAILQRFSASTDDAHGNATDTYAAGESITGCAFDPGGTADLADTSRRGVETEPTLYAPAGTVVGSQDRIVVRGLAYEVAGDAADWRSPFTGWHAGVVIPLRRVSG